MGFKGTDLSQIKRDDALDTERDVVAIIGEIRMYKEQAYYDAKFINRAKKKGFQSDGNDAVFEQLKDVDTKAYIEDAKDMSTGPEGVMPTDYNPEFSDEQIPF